MSLGVNSCDGRWLKRKKWLGLVLLAVGGSLLAQLNRATITGVVTDPTGALIPGVRIVVTNTATNASYPTITTDAGQYNVPNLPIGPYSVAFEAAGLKRLVRQNVELRINDVLVLDVQMEVGQLTDTISVTAEISRIQNQNPGVGTDLANKSLIDLPLSIANRLPENFAYAIVPGVTGSPGSTRMDGAALHSNETLLDGESVSTLRGGHFSESSPSVEAVGEFRVQPTGATAEFGRTGGGVLNFVMKSGSNNIHGSVFGALRNEALNANSFVNNFSGGKRPQDRRQSYAFSFGGPVHIPKVYDGKNRSFFYAAYERFRQRNMALGAPIRTGPIPDFYEGNFSRLLGPVISTKDALGRDVLRGAIYDPNTFRQLDNRRWIGDMFPGNRIPVSRFSQVSRNLNAIAQKQYTPTIRDATGQIALTNNLRYPATSSPKSDQHQFSVKGDENINRSHRLSGTYSMTLRPRWLIQRGMWAESDPQGGVLSQGGPQIIDSYLGRLAHDWTMTPHMLNYIGLSYNRQTQWSINFDTSVDGAAAMGIKNLSTTGYPTVNWGGGPFVSQDSIGNLNNRFDAWSSWGFRDTLSWNIGRHFVKAGVDLRRNYMNYTTRPNSAFTFNAVSTAIPNETFSGNQTGYAFASYLLGIVRSGDNWTDSLVTSDRRFYYGLFVQDDFKVNRRLTLQLGMRWEYMPPLFEQYNRIASWSPTKIDPESGRPGAYEFAGDCRLCAGQNYFGLRDFNNFAPRVGFAYRLATRATLRSAYGVFYDVDLPGLSQFGTSWLFPWIGTYPLNADPLAPWRGAFNWDNGFPVSRYVPPTFDESWGNRNAPSGVDPRYGISPYNQHWNLNLQTELPARITLDVGYIGSKATKLRNGNLVRLNQMRPESLAQYGTNLGRTVRSAAEAAAAGVSYPYSGFSGTVASSLRPYPQVLGNSTISQIGSPEGFSTYHSLQVVLDKRLSQGLNAYVNYVWSKALTNTNTSATARGTDQPTMLDYYNRVLEKALSDADIPHAFKAYIAYELPAGKGHIFGGWDKVSRALMGGWSVSTILNYFSGTPIRFSASSPYSLWNGGTNRPNVQPGDLVKGFSKDQFDYAHASTPGTNVLLDKSKFSDPGSLRLGSGAPNYSQVRSFPERSENCALHKNTPLGEKVRFQIRAEFISIFNRSKLGGINTNVTSPLFGQVTNISGNRELQFGARLDF